MSIAEFLLARIAEDEAVARGHDPGNASAPWSHYHHASRFNGPRVLAECEAKRRIVGRAADTAAWDHHDEYAAEALGLETAIGLLAAVYSDHPDFQQEWKL